PVFRAACKSLRGRGCGRGRGTGARRRLAYLVARNAWEAPMKPVPFTYILPHSVEHILDALAEYGSDARIMAGGQSLMAMLNLRLVEPKALIDISRLEELRGIHIDGNFLEVGAAVTQAEFLSWPHLEK